MPFTALQIQNIANGALDFYIRGGALDSAIQDKPLLDAFMKSQKTFPGGRGSISIPVKGDRTTAIMGYSQDDTVSYANPANIKRVNYPWKEIHAGITFTGTELKIDGISVVDSTTGAKTVEHTQRELTVLTGLLEDKLDDMAKGWAESFNRMLWLDGTQDAKQVPGVQALISQTPTTGMTGGLDRATNWWWRNRSITALNGGKIVSSVANQTLSATLRNEVRQLRRYGGRPNLPLCGSFALQQLEAEVYAKGYLTMEGFQNNGKNDIGIASITMRNVGTFLYDPTLDDLGMQDFIFLLDLNHLVLRVMDGEDKKQHTPARPYDKYTYYRAMTWTGGMTVDQLNCHGIYQVA
jgi:hypothetical protein